MNSKQIIKIPSIIFLAAMTGQVFGQVGTRFDNYEEANYVSSMKSDDFTYLIWDRNNDGTAFSTATRPMFMYWDNDDNQLGYLIDTRNMTELSASFHSANIRNGLMVTGGNVGIGTSSPSELLDVNGNVSISQKLVGPMFTIDLDAGTYHKRITSNQVGGGATMELQTMSDLTSSLQTRLLIRGNGSNDIELYDKNANQFVNFDGDAARVGIGTTTPTEKLEVNGTIRSKEVKVEASPWPDYVFEPNYQLRSLEEIEKFIQAEKHLPDVPSSAEVEENGIALGEMNALLLKKIEELTLYTIEQDIQIKNLNAAKVQEPIANCLQKKIEELTLM